MILSHALWGLFFFFGKADLDFAFLLERDVSLSVPALVFSLLSAIQIGE